MGSVSRFTLADGQAYEFERPAPPEISRRDRHDDRPLESAGALPRITIAVDGVDQVTVPSTKRLRKALAKAAAAT